jgi:surfeit locus 1 family protein
MKQTGMRPSAIGLVAVLAAAVAVLCALGTWQVARLLDAREAEARREQHIAEPPLDWRSDSPLTAEQLDYRRVSVSGRWDNSRTLLIANRVQYDMLGREAVTPLLPDDGGPAVLVNRGWFPDSRREEVLAALATQQAGTVEGLARVRDDLQPGRALPSGEWTRLDPEVMGAGLPYPVVEWQLVEGRRETAADERFVPTSFPVQLYAVGGQEPPHLDYALTWYGLAAALVATAVIRFRPRREGAAAQRGATHGSEDAVRS